MREQMEEEREQKEEEGTEVRPNARGRAVRRQMSWEFFRFFSLEETEAVRARIVCLCVRVRVRVHVRVRVRVR